MRILHTADWHIGQTFFDHDRREEHRFFLSWLKEQVKAHSVDLLLISGDVFDTPNPSAASQQIYYRFLRDVTAENPALQVIVIAGNHDSAARLEAPAPLLQEHRITVRGRVRRLENGDIDLEHLMVPLDKGGLCLAVPYLRQGDYPPANSYPLGVQRMYEVLCQQIREIEGPVIAMGHLQVAGGSASEKDRSERLIMGGLEAVSFFAFPELLTYTALGHLHRAQSVGRDTIRYAGAPLPMSFSEKNYRRGVVLVEIAKSVTVGLLPFDAPAPLWSIPEQPLPSEEVLRAIAQLPEGEWNAFSPFVEIKVRISGPEPSLRYRVEEALQGKAVRLAKITPEYPEKAYRKKLLTYEEIRAVDPMQIATDHYRANFGGEEMPQPMRKLLQKVIEEARS